MRKGRSNLEELYFCEIVGIKIDHFFFFIHSYLLIFDYLLFIMMKEENKSVLPHQQKSPSNSEIMPETLKA